MASSKRSVEKEQFWRLVMQEHASSGLSVRAFCQREAISEASFFYWRRTLAARDDGDAQADSKPDRPSIVPVQVIGQNPASGSGQRPEHHARSDDSLAEGVLQADHAMVHIATPGGFTLRAAVTTDVQVITAWLGAIAKVTSP